MKVVEANKLTLTACSIAESDTADGATWSSTTTYAVDALVRYNHVRYQSLVASNVGNDPSVVANTSGTDKKWRILGAMQHVERGFKPMRAGGSGLSSR